MILLSYHYIILPLALQCLAIYYFHKFDVLFAGGGFVFCFCWWCFVFSLKKKQMMFSSVFTWITQWNIWKPVIILRYRIHFISVIIFLVLFILCSHQINFCGLFIFTPICLASSLLDSDVLKKCEKLSKAASLFLSVMNALIWCDFIQGITEQAESTALHIEVTEL